MEVAKVTSKGQITIPISIRRRLDINEGDKVLFIYKQEGVMMVNPNTYQGGSTDIIERAEIEQAAEAIDAAKEKGTTKSSQSTKSRQPEADEEEIFVEVDVIYEESDEKATPEPEATQVKSPAADKQVGGLDLSTLLDDIRSIGSNI